MKITNIETYPVWGGHRNFLFVVVDTDEGISGVGEAGITGRELAVAGAIEHFKPLLIGQDPGRIEHIWQVLFRGGFFPAQRVLTSAMAAIDIALWDIKGKALGVPIYELLGGLVRDKVVCYPHNVDRAMEIQSLVDSCLQTKAEGCKFVRWGLPQAGSILEPRRAVNTAIQQFHAVREAVGDAYTLMFDAFMGWNVPYATAMVRALEPLNPFWMEEPIPPERVGELAKLRNASRVPLATGEHIFTRWQTKELLVSQGTDFLQNDPDWTGGITELVKVAALASSFETPLVAHGHSLLPALHVAGSQSPATIPFVEYLIRHQYDKQNLHQMVYAPEKGEVKLPEGPGLGFMLDEKKIKQRTPWQA